MAESLASYFEKNSLNSVGFGVAGIQGSSATTSRGPVSRTWDVRRGSYGNELNITRGDCFQGTVARGPGFILGDSTQSQERNGGLRLNEKAPMDPRLENRMKEVENGGSSPSSSSFEFHVSSEEGISLSVDLDFNPSDWINSMTSEVNVYDSMRPRKPPHSDPGIDNATNCKKQKTAGQDKDGDARRESSLSPAKKDCTQGPSDHHANGELYLASSAMQPCLVNGVNSVPDSSAPGHIVSSCAESCSKSCCVNPVDLECVDPPGKKLTSDTVMVAAEQNLPAGDDLLVEIPQNPSMESFQKVGAGSELSSSEAEAYPSNALCSPRKTSRSSVISSSEPIIDRESTSYSESFKFRYNGDKNRLPPDSEEQEKSEVFSEQARLE